MEIPIHYDNMIAKLITFGNTREDAINRMIRAIKDYHITGIETTLAFGSFVMQHEAFVSGNFDTKFIEKHFKSEYLNSSQDDAKIAAISAGMIQIASKDSSSNEQQIANQIGSNWMNKRKTY